MTAVLRKSPIEIYHQKDGRISKSMLTDLLDCPALFKYWHEGEGHKKPQADHLDIGNAVHTLAIEPHLFNERFAVVPSGMARNAKHEKYQKFCEENVGKIHLLASDSEMIMDMAKSLKDDKAAMLLLDRKGMVEHDILWSEDYPDPETGEVTTLKWKARPDILTDDGTEMVIDIKTTADIRPFAFSKSCENFGYALSVALTNRAYIALTGKPLQNYIFIALSKDEPYLIESYDAFRVHDECVQSMLDRGNEQLDLAIATLLRCRKTGEWPKYNSEPISPVRVPLWQRSK